MAIVPFAKKSRVAIGSGITVESA